jgi:biotin carboxyl carrier protein
MITVKVNNKQIYNIENNGDELLIDGKTLQWDISKINERRYHIIYNNKSYEAEILEEDSLKKSLLIKIGNEEYTIEIKNKLDRTIDELGISKRLQARSGTIYAPMPGQIVELKVAEGDKVKKGDPLLILKAMKMENIIYSKGDGPIRSIHVREGENVEKQQILIQF